jgi:hypothetical protein
MEEGSKSLVLQEQQRCASLRQKILRLQHTPHHQSVIVNWNWFQAAIRRKFWRAVLSRN